MTTHTDATTVDFNDEDSTTSANPTFDSVLNARLSRRDILRGSVGALTPRCSAPAP